MCNVILLVCTHLSCIWGHGILVMLRICSTSSKRTRRFLTRWMATWDLLRLRLRVLLRQRQRPVPNDLALATAQCAYSSGGPRNVLTAVRSHDETVFINKYVCLFLLVLKGTNMNIYIYIFSNDSNFQPGSGLMGAVFIACCCGSTIRLES